MKFLISLVLLVCLSSAMAGHGKFGARFSSFKSRFGKNYASRAEEIKRFTLVFFPLDFCKVIFL